MIFWVHVLTSLPRSVGYKVGTAFIAPDIKSLLSHVRRSIEAVDDAAENVNDSTMAQLLKILTKTHRQAEDTGKDVKELRMALAEMARELQAQNEAVSGQNAVFHYLLEHLSRLISSADS